MNRSLNIDRWSPALFGDFRKEMDRLVNSFYEDGERSPFFAPQGDLAETETSYELSLDLPGMKPEEVEIEFKDGHLWVSGERKEVREEGGEGKTFHHVERKYGKFRRVIALGNEIEADQIDATYKDGVLTVTLPKVAKAQPKRIEVRQ